MGERREWEKDRREWEKGGNGREARMGPKTPKPQIFEKIIIESIVAVAQPLVALPSHLSGTQFATGHHCLP